MSERRRLLLVLGALFAVFVGTVALRAPWRGHLAEGDSWVTAQTLRFAAAWERDGALRDRLALVLTPPTREFQGDERLFKWGLPGHQIFVHVVTKLLGLDVNVTTLMQINLVLHGILCLELALLASALARNGWIGRPDRASLASLHCGLFVLLLPPLLFWGQNLSVQMFTILPLFVFVVAGRWLRPTLTSDAARRRLDRAVAVCVFFGTLCDFFFWVLIPYLVAVRAWRSRRGRPHTQDPWRRTLVRPMALSLACFLVVTVASGQTVTMLGRAGHWAAGGSGGGLAELAFSRSVGPLLFLVTHFASAFTWAGGVSLVLGGGRILRGRETPVLSPEGRGILVDLLLPCVFFLFALAPHQAAHTFSAMKWTPFVALVWTVLTPALLRETQRRGRRALRVAYAVIAVWILLPATNDYERYFPEPRLEWGSEADFVRDAIDPADRAFSPATEIRLVPPQRIALGERRVLHVYAVLDLHNYLIRAQAEDRVAIYAPDGCPTHLAPPGAQRIIRGRRCVLRFSKGDFDAFVAGDPHRRYLRHSDAIHSGLVRGSSPQRRGGRLPALDFPLALHITRTNPGSESPSLSALRIYWQSDQRFHLIEAPFPASESVTLDDRTFGVQDANWHEFGGVDGRTLEWVTFIRRLFRDAGRGEPTWRTRWEDLQVVEAPLAAVPPVLADWTDTDEAWKTQLLYDAGRPVAAILTAGATPSSPLGLHRVVVLIDELTVGVRVPGILENPWSVRKEPPPVAPAAIPIGTEERPDPETPRVSPAAAPDSSAAH